MDPIHKLIINADDFGYSVERNKGIVELINFGYITSVSLMVNAQAAHDAVLRLRSSSVSIGLHVNLSEGKALSGSSSLTDKDGKFLGKQGIRQAVSKGVVLQTDVEFEIKLQIAKFLELCGDTPSHIDGHQHVHVFPGIAEVFAREAERVKIRFTRLPLQKSLTDCDWLQPQKREFFSSVAADCRSARSLFCKHNLKFPGFTGLSCMGSDMCVEHLRSAVELCVNSNASDSSCTELMVHPGYRSAPGSGGCGQGPDSFSRSTERENEMAVLSSKQWTAYLQKSNILLVSFKDL